MLCDWFFPMYPNHGYYVLLVFTLGQNILNNSGTVYIACLKVMYSWFFVVAIFCLEFLLPNLLGLKGLKKKKVNHGLSLMKRNSQLYLLAKKSGKCSLRGQVSTRANKQLCTWARHMLVLMLWSSCQRLRLQATHLDVEWVAAI